MLWFGLLFSFLDLFCFMQMMEPGKMSQQERTGRPQVVKAQSRRVVVVEDEEEEEDEVADEDVQRFVKVLRNGQVQQLLRRALTGTAQEIPCPLLATSPFLAKGCVELFQRIGVWSVPSSRVEEEHLKVCLSSWLAKHNVQVWFPKNDRANLQTDAGRQEMASLILRSFASADRTAFPGEGKRKGSIDWAGSGRKLRQIAAFKVYAAQDLAYSDWYMQRIELGEAEDAVFIEAQELQRHINGNEMSEAGWVAFFSRLNEHCAEFDTDDARAALRSAYENGENKVSFLNLIPRLLNSTAYSKQMTALSGVASAPVDLDIVSEHEDDE